MLLMSPLVLFKRNSRVSDWRIHPKTEEDTETCFSPPQASKNTSQESFSMKKLRNNPMTKEQILSNMSPHWVSFQVSRLTKDLESSTQKDKTGPRDLMLFQPWPKNFTNWDVDLLSGELFFKSEKECHQNKRFNKMLGVWQDTQLFASKTVWFQSLSLRFYQMVRIQQNIVKKLLKKF